jgi:hypothetical protein
MPRQRLTGALLDRLTHHVHILEMNGDSYRLKQSKRRQRSARSTDTLDHAALCALGFVTSRFGVEPCRANRSVTGR